MVGTPPNPSPSFLKKLPNKVIELLSLPLLYSPSFFFTSKQAISIGRPKLNNFLNHSTHIISMQKRFPESHFNSHYKLKTLRNCSSRSKLNSFYPSQMNNKSNHFSQVDQFVLVLIWICNWYIYIYIFFFNLSITICHINKC